MTGSTNPYFRLPIGFNPQKFYGSARWVQFVLGEISAGTPRSLELIGLPGMAKTTLLRYLADPAGALHRDRAYLQAAFQQEPARLFPILVEFRRLPSEQHPFVYLAECFYAEYATYRPGAAAALGRSLPALAPPAPGEPETPEGAIDGVESAIRALAGAGIRPVFLLDDFDLAFAPMTADQATRLRPLRDLVAFVLVTERPLHVVNPRAVGSPFFQTLPLIRLGGLEPDEARRILEEPAQQAGSPFPRADVDFVLKYTGGHPYLLFLAGQALWEMRDSLGLLAQAETALPAEHHKVLRGRLLKDFDRTFQLYRERLEDPAEWHALKTLVGEGPAALGDDDYPALASLQLKGLVRYIAETGYAPFSSLFRDFLKNNPDPVPARAEPALTGLEGNLYAYLRRHADRICTFEELWREVWDGPVPTDKDVIRRRTQVTVSRLRQKLQKATGEDILSVRDQGYRLLARGAAGPEPGG